MDDELMEHLHYIKMFAEKENWPELEEMMQKAFKKKDDKLEIFAKLLYYRLNYKRGVKEPFNRVSAWTRHSKGKSELCYTVHNYNFDMFCWAMEHNCASEIDTTNFNVYESQMSPKELADFNARCDYYYLKSAE